MVFCCQLAAHMSRRPNVLFVFGDQWRAQSTGFGGNAEVRTPCLDEFARGAIHLPLAISSCPVCTPWRASFLTGLNPDRHGLFLNDAPLDPDLPTIGKAFRAAGYETGWIGKWHVDGNGRMACIPPGRRHGFDYWKVLECTHRYNESYYYSGDSETRLCWPGYDALAQTRDAIEWLRGREGDRPFFLALSWGPPHSPYRTAPAPYLEMYDRAQVTVPANVPAGMEAGVRRNLAGYYAHASVLDQAFGELETALTGLGLAEDTLVVFTSDHGDMLGAHGLYDKQCPWEESIRVPLLLRWPNGLGGEGRESRLLFQTTDFYPTLAALAGVAAPAGLAGRDFSNHLADGTVPENNHAFLAAYHNFGNWPGQAAARGDPLIAAREFRGVRTERHTYVESRQGPWLLYDNESDPWQMVNRVDDPAAGSVRAHLAALLRGTLRDYGDAFEPGSEYVRRWGYPVNTEGTLGWPDAEEWASKGI